MMLNVHNFNKSSSLAFKYNEDKNSWLKQTRGIDFEKIIEAIHQGFLLDIKPNPNQGRYPNQDMYIVKIEHWVYVVPFAQKENEIFLKTAFPSRKAYKQYIQQQRGYS